MTFEEINLSVFRDCLDQLQFDEIFVSDKFTVHHGMHALDVGHKKIDAHTICDGICSIEDIPLIEDENLVPEQIFDIGGQMIDLLSSRLNGHNSLLNVFALIYIDKSYVVKNPLLKLLSLSFAKLVYRIESFSSEFIPKIVYQVWSFCPNYQNYVSGEYSLEDLQKQFENSSDQSEKDVLNLSNFFLDLELFIANKFFFSRVKIA